VKFLGNNLDRRRARLNVRWHRYLSSVTVLLLCLCASPEASLALSAQSPRGLGDVPSLVVRARAAQPSDFKRVSVICGQEYDGPTTCPDGYVCGPNTNGGSLQDGRPTQYQCNEGPELQRERERENARRIEQENAEHLVELRERAVEVMRRAREEEPASAEAAAVRGAAAQPVQSHIRQSMPSLPPASSQGKVASVQPQPDRHGKAGSVETPSLGTPHVKPSLPAALPHEANAASVQPPEDRNNKVVSVQKPLPGSSSHIKTSLPSPPGEKKLATKDVTCIDVNSNSCVQAPTGTTNGPTSVTIGNKPITSQQGSVASNNPTGDRNVPTTCPSWAPMGPHGCQTTGGVPSTVSAHSSGGYFPPIGLGLNPLDALLAALNGVTLPEPSLPLLADNGPSSPPSAEHDCEPKRGKITIWAGPASGCLPCAGVDATAKSDEDKKRCAQPDPTPATDGCTCPDGAITVDVHLSATEQQLADEKTNNGLPPVPPCAYPGGSTSFNDGPRAKDVTWTNIDGDIYKIHKNEGIYVKDGKLIVCAKDDNKKCPPGQRVDVNADGGVPGVRGQTCLPPTVVGWENPVHNGWLGLDCAMWRDRKAHNLEKACPKPAVLNAPAPSASKQ
jgi:hypothetical protein